ncbi:polysaccharide pyruvyl transferase family protein [Sutcliffiella halmapala]|uniref:polysaccharide pyruvyl transferase family protein n=1 Tax=Sutcliffiella halmapala TaxID=79882 RepID=UPI0009956F11|nr:polysaccharide pyruvyl transferase family protein [Sutcliffiella halmapala]
MKVLIHGFYGAGNAGDDAILQSIIETLKEVDQHVEVAVSIRSATIPAYFGKEKISYVRGGDIPSITKVLKQCDLLIVGGGGLFQDYNSYLPENLFTNQKGAINYYSYPIILAKMLNIKVMLYALGIGPLRNPESKKAMKWVSEIVDTITVRDTESFDLLTSLGVTKHVLSADPVVNLTATPTSLPRSMTENRSKNDIKVGLNLRNWSYATDDLHDFQHMLIKYLNDLSSHYPLSIYVFPFNKLPSETAMAEELVKALTGKVQIIPYNASPQDYKFLCGQLDLMIAMRLHANIFAIYEGVPSLGISYDGKVRQFFQELDLHEYCHTLGNRDYASFKTIIKDCIKNPAQHKQNLKGKLKHLQGREHLNKATLIKTYELIENE